MNLLKGSTGTLHGHLSSCYWECTEESLGQSAMLICGCVQQLPVTQRVREILITRCETTESVSRANLHSAKKSCKILPSINQAAATTGKTEHRLHKILSLAGSQNHCQTISIYHTAWPWNQLYLQLRLINLMTDKSDKVTSSDGRFKDTC